jgi:hypothetical protein
MPKSKNRKDQKKKSKLRTQSIKNAKDKFQKDLISMMQKQQQTQIDNKIKESENSNIVENVDVGDII